MLNMRPKRRWGTSDRFFAYFEPITKEAVAMSEGFRRQVFVFAERHGIPIIRFEKGMRKDDVMHKRLRKFKAPEGVVFIGIAQEKARVPRTIRKRFGEGESTIPWIDYTTPC